MDPYIGSVELPAGRYFLAVTNRSQVPAVLANRLDRTLDTPINTSDAEIRLQPINSNRYIVEDRVDGRRGAAAQAPIVPQFFAKLVPSRVCLRRCSLYLLQDIGIGSSDVYLANPFTGEVSNYVGRNAEDLNDFATRPNGDIRGFRGLERGTQTDANAEYLLIDPGTGATTINGNFNTITRQLDLTVS